MSHGLTTNTCGKLLAFFTTVLGLVKLLIVDAGNDARTTIRHYCCENPNIRDRHKHIKRLTVGLYSDTETIVNK